MPKSKAQSDLFVFEIGVEEIPSEYLNSALCSWKRVLEQLLKDQGITYLKLTCFSTPRRLVLKIENLSKSQEAKSTEVIGPAKEIAYDQNGQPTAALLGFLKSQKASLQELYVKETPKGAKIAICLKSKAEGTEKLLPSLLVQSVARIEFPKTMRWNATGFRFVRPIRWILALWNAKLIPLEIADLRSGKTTRGHRFLANRAVVCKNAQDYFTQLKKLHVTLDFQERQQEVVRQMKAFSKKYNIQIANDAELLEKVTNLVEKPFLISGSFRKNYLRLPSEVLATCMKKNQKIFACYDSKGKMVERFVGVLNGKRNSLPQIQRDYEDVLESRLRDAEFFYKEDTKTRLEEKVSRLKEIVFLAGVGNVYERTERLQKLSRFLAAELKLQESDQKHAQRAAFLCKADLVAQMVYEFPELQGVMGGEYARHDGEAPEVALAIARHYFPRSLSEDIQKDNRLNEFPAVVLAISDKIDALTAAFANGMELSGSEDPYALRRAAGGVVKLVLAYNLHFSLGRVIEEAHKLLGSKVKLDATQVVDKLRRVFRDRIQFALNSSQMSQVQQELLKAVLETDVDNLSGVKLRFDQLVKLSEKEPDLFFQACKVVERTENILKGIKGKAPDAINAQKFVEPIENQLFECLESTAPSIERHFKENRFDLGVEVYGRQFFNLLDEFFAKVMINAEDAEVRSNRQALMNRLNRLITKQCANLAKIESVVSIRLMKSKQSV
jgi:glycyl-tRNA synthetase beta chain